MINECFISMSHRDPELEARRTWYLQQPGCVWHIDGEPADTMARLMITRSGVTLHYRSQKLSFHPSMALLRIINIRRGVPDRYLEATGLEPGDRLLDLTLGLATDALIGAAICGPSGSVLGIESSGLLAAVMSDGLRHLANDAVPKVRKQDKLLAWQELSRAAERVEVHWADHFDLLCRLPERSVDVIYLDPMFRLTCTNSSSIRPVYFLADHRPLMLETIHEARRVARKRIVLKERKGSSEFARLGFDVLTGGRYSAIDYGVISI